MDPAVGLVETYLRLNGFFTVTEFQVQQPLGHSGTFETATDLDILAVRFPRAGETVLRHPARHGEPRCEIVLADDPLLAVTRTMPDILIGEVKEGAGAVNRGLLTPDVLHAALRRVGCCAEDHIGPAVDALLRRGQFVTNGGESVSCRLRLASFAGRFDSPPTPAVLTVTLEHIVRFLEAHLRAYHDVLRSAHFKDPLLSLFKLFEKLQIGLVPPARPTSA